MAALRTEVFFIVDGDRLQAQACLLAASLKQHLGPDQHAVAYVRQDTGDLSPLTLHIFEGAGVEIREISNTEIGHAPWAAPYPHGNKILAAAQYRACDVSVFLDTDTIMAEPIDFAAHLGDALIGACISDYQSKAGEEADWAQYYKAFGMPLPQERVQLQAGRRLQSLPYFNAGMVIFRERYADGTPTGVGRDWLGTALKFEADVTGDYNRSNIDQFSLPILGYLRGAPVKALEQRLNFNIEAFGKGDGLRQSLVHYHRIGVLWGNRYHGRRALAGFEDLAGDGAAKWFVEEFGPHLKRSRMKHHVRANASAAA